MADFNANFIDNDSATFNAQFNATQQIITGEVDYVEQVYNKPKINGVTLVGDKTSAEIHVQDPIGDITPQQIDAIIFG